MATESKIIPNKLQNIGLSRNLYRDTSAIGSYAQGDTFQSSLTNYTNITNTSTVSSVAAGTTLTSCSINSSSLSSCSLSGCTITSGSQSGQTISGSTINTSTIVSGILTSPTMTGVVKINGINLPTKHYFGSSTVAPAGSGFTISSPSLGEYTITHSLGSIGYLVYVTPTNATPVYYSVAKALNTTTIYIYSSLGVPVASNFDYQIIVI